jgi:hypothetical protein
MAYGRIASVLRRTTRRRNVVTGDDISALCHTYGCLFAIALGVAVACACGDLTVPILGRIAPGLPSGEAASPPLDAASLPLRYEAEGVPPNVLIQSAIADTTCFGTNQICEADGVKEGANCCSGSGEVTEMLGRVPCDGPPGSAADYMGCQMIGGGVEFHDVTVAVDGTYDVTWWYHCGENNSYGDTACGGVHYAVGSSCRPHLIDVNGVSMAGAVDGQAALIYQLPCYSGAWSILHGATTALPLKAGANIVFIHAPQAITLDGADIDAIDVLPQGRGIPPLVTPVVSGY